MAACLGKKKIEIEDTDATRTQPTARYDPRKAQEDVECLQKALGILCKIQKKEEKERERPGYKSKTIPGLEIQYKDLDVEKTLDKLHKSMKWECQSCTHLQDEAKWLKDELNESKRVNKDSDAQLQRQQEDEHILKKKLETYKKEIENLKNQIHSLQDEKKRIKDDLNESQKAHKDSDAQLQRQQEDEQTLKKKLETYKKEIENLNNQIQRTEDECRKATEKWHELQSENEGLQRELHEADQTSKENQEIYTREKKDLSDQLHNLQGERNRQEKTLDKTLRENQALNDRIHRQRAEVETERKAKDDALLRLSAIASSRLRDNNPNITDLSDENRPTKLGEKMCELYDNEWTDAFDVLESAHDEFKCIQLLLQVFETAFVEISKKATKQMELVREAITWEDQDAKELIKAFKDMRKKKTGFFIIEHSPEIAKTVSEIVGSAAGSKPLQTYIDKSIECCWIMVVQDPPLCLHKSQLFESFDTKLFREYTARGPFLQFVVWPTVLLHKDGPILAKGVAQGGPAEEVNKDVDPQSRPAVEQAQGVAQGGPAKEVNEDDDTQSRPAEEKAQTGDNQGDVNSTTENPSDVHNDDNKQADVDIKHTRNQGDVVNSNTDNLSDDDNDDNDDNKQADFDI